MKIIKIISAVCAYQIPKLHSTIDKNLKTIFLNNFSSWGWSTWRDRWNEYKTGSVKKNIFNHNLISKIDKIVKNKKIFGQEILWFIIILKIKFTFFQINH